MRLNDEDTENNISRWLKISKRCSFIGNTIFIVQLVLTLNWCKQINPIYHSWIGILKRQESESNDGHLHFPVRKKSTE